MNGVKDGARLQRVIKTATNRKVVCNYYCIKYYQYLSNNYNIILVTQATTFSTNMIAYLSLLRFALAFGRGEHPYFLQELFLLFPSP